MPDLEIRKAELADVGELAELNRLLIADERHPNPMTVAELAERMRTWLGAEYVGYLGLVAGKVVAYALYREDGAHHYLRHLYVARQHRRRGVATALLDWLYANVWHDKSVRTDVLAHNSGAITFYKRYGFKTGCPRMEK